MWINPKEYKPIGSALAAARVASGLTQTVVARRLRKPQSFVSDYELGKRRVDLVEFLRIAEVVGADPVRLLGRIVATRKRGKSGT